MAAAAPEESEGKSQLHDTRDRSALVSAAGGREIERTCRGALVSVRLYYCGTVEASSKASKADSVATQGRGR